MQKEEGISFQMWSPEAWGVRTALSTIGLEFGAGSTPMGGTQGAGSWVSLLCGLQQCLLMLQPPSGCRGPLGGRAFLQRLRLQCWSTELATGRTGGLWHCGAARPQQGMKLWATARGISAQGVRTRSGSPQSLLGHEDGRKRGAVVWGEKGVSARRSVLWGESRGLGDSARVFGKHLQRFVTLRTPCAGALCLQWLCFLHAAIAPGSFLPCPGSKRCP